MTFATTLSVPRRAPHASFHALTRRLRGTSIGKLGTAARCVAVLALVVALGLLIAFVQVVRQPVAAAQARGRAGALLAEASWPCLVTPGAAARDACLRDLPAMAAEARPLQAMLEPLDAAPRR